MKQTSVYAQRLRSYLCSLNFISLRKSLNRCATLSICFRE